MKHRVRFPPSRSRNRRIAHNNKPIYTDLMLSQWYRCGNMVSECSSSRHSPALMQSIGLTLRLPPCLSRCPVVLMQKNPRCPFLQITGAAELLKVQTCSPSQAPIMQPHKGLLIFKLCPPSCFLCFENDSLMVANLSFLRPVCHDHCSLRIVLGAIALIRDSQRNAEF